MGSAHVHLPPQELQSLPHLVVSDGILSSNIDKIGDEVYFPLNNQSLFMAEGINVRFAGTLHQFIQEKTSSGGLYNSASEYIRDLVRHDYENSRRARLEDFYDELETTLTAPSGEFVPFDVEKIIRDGKTRRSKADP